MTELKDQEPPSEPRLEPLADWITEGARQYAEVLDSEDSTPIALLLTLWEANHVQMVANTRAIDSLELPIRVSGTRLTILRTLYFAPGRQMALSAIAKKSGTNLSVVISLIDALKQGGLVERVGSKMDRRVSIAQLTPAGEEAFLKVLPALSARMTEARSLYTEEEMKTLLSLLQRLL